MKKITTFALFLTLSFSLSTIAVPSVLCTENFWITMKSMPTARAGIGVAVVNGKIYAIGGREGWAGSPISAANERYTPIGYIPEFPSWIILPLFLIVTLFAVVIKKKVTHPIS